MPTLATLATLATPRVSPLKKNPDVRWWGLSSGHLALLIFLNDFFLRVAKVAKVAKAKTPHGSPCTCRVRLWNSRN